MNTVNVNQESNESLHKSLFLEIILSGSDFNGLLNFGAVEVESAGNKYILDALDTEGNPSELNGEEVYRLKTTFSSYEDTKDTFEESYDFSLSLKEILAGNPTATTNLYSESLISDEENAVENNIKRVISMNLCDPVTGVKIPVCQNDDF